MPGYLFLEKRPKNPRRLFNEKEQDTTIKRFKIAGIGPHFTTKICRLKLKTFWMVRGVGLSHSPGERFQQL